MSGEPALPLRGPGHGGGGTGAGRCAVLARVQESARAVHHGDEDNSHDIMMIIDLMQVPALIGLKGNLEMTLASRY